MKKNLFRRRGSSIPKPPPLKRGGGAGRVPRPKRQSRKQQPAAPSDPIPAVPFVLSPPTNLIQPLAYLPSLPWPYLLSSPAASAHHLVTDDYIIAESDDTSLLPQRESKAAAAACGWLALPVASWDDNHLKLRLLACCPSAPPLPPLHSNRASSTREPFPFHFFLPGLPCCCLRTCLCFMFIAWWAEKIEKQRLSWSSFVSKNRATSGIYLAILFELILLNLLLPSLSWSRDWLIAAFAYVHAVLLLAMDLCSWLYWMFGSIGSTLAKSNLYYLTGSSFKRDT